MNSKNFKKYAKLIKDKIGLEESVIEKDYMVSLFLTNAKKLIDEGKITKFTNLVFKGGTLLTKAYLNYHRISEDLDFTHKDSNKIRTISSTNRREKRIKKIIIKLLDEIKKISDYSDMYFETKRTNKKFVNLKNSRNIYILNIYYDSRITNTQSSIKIEINFVEEQLNKPINKELNLLSKKFKLDNTLLKSIKFDLEKTSMLSYQLKEIILEKYRAILTRKELKERDVFDLYLLNKKENILNYNNNEIIKKIKNNMTLNVSKSNYKSNKNKIVKDTFWKSDDDIEKLSLIKINQKDYNKFKEKLSKKLKEIISIY